MTWQERVRQTWADFIGPEATPTNERITAGVAAVGAAIAPVIARRRGGSVPDAVIASGLAADLWGGAYVNNTRACARRYHGDGTEDADRLRFVALHAHPALIAWLDRHHEGRVRGVAKAAARYGYLIAATQVIASRPRYRRSLGYGLTAGGILLDRVLGGSTAAPWFAWAYYPKLLLGHGAASLWSDDDLDA
ncbi:hypothetical protein BHE97_03090 [Aeromicrobium sp. PE09-221]|uniref:hypothetical protein n=1 Tax=Aeromicrobium sp. PE09-221 TaxID=1898043 RepID=UPI000B654484|nr:hypothetical protein [Aeromicrobium sp. PE09-221]OUZ12238.1 hypothetical protein BHE97_03090 [Aeromicrobium sp. PE09-221]